MMDSQSIDNSLTGNHVCVIGAGALGLVATKNLVEQGLKVTTLERNEYVGGLWRASTKSNQVSVLESTKANTSKYIVCRQGDYS
jgi:dimethylaniline monooxygenase (N-oxide forming)